MKTAELIKSESRKIRFAAVCFLCLFSLQSFASDEGYHLKGTIKGKYSGYLYLYYNDSKDSTLVKDQQFEFKGKVAFPCAALIVTSTQDACWSDFYLENSNMQITIAISHEQAGGQLHYKGKVTSFSGSRTEVLRTGFNHFKSENAKAPNRNALIFERLSELSKQYPKNSLIGNLILECDEQNWLTPEQIAQLIAHIDPASQTPFVIETLKLKASGQAMGVGKRCPLLSLQNQDGRRWNTAGLEGKYYLVDFWASSCRKCRNDFYGLKQLYSKFAARGFEIVSVGLDKDKDMWKATLAEENLPWIKLYDAGEFAAETAIAFSVQTLPGRFLVDDNGVIVLKDMTPQALDTYLAAHLKK